MDLPLSGTKTILVSADDDTVRKIEDFARRLGAEVARPSDPAAADEEQLRERLRQSDKLMLLGQIAAGIAQEINNPLTSVSSYSQLLGLRLSDPKTIECADRIHEGIERIHRLVRNLTSFVQPSQEMFYPLDLNEIVADTLSFSRYDLARGETRLLVELDPELPKVLGVKDQLEHLLMNLLTNARDAVGGRGTITVRTATDDAGVTLRVDDDGVGIAPSDRERIFEPFYTTKPEGKGTGLGLFIAAGIARKHDAEITVDSTAGRGTRVSFSLPAFRPWAATED
jgi:signal transduction histidine kinase